MTNPILSLPGWIIQIIGVAVFFPSQLIVIFISSAYWYLLENSIRAGYWIVPSKSWDIRFFPVSNVLLFCFELRNYLVFIMAPYPIRISSPARAIFSFKTPRKSCMPNIGHQNDIVKIL